jgi:hypothetical protein
MVRIHPAPLAVCILVVAAVAFGGCASTSLVSQWKSPAFSGPPLKKVLVVGVSSQPGPRRIFEDEFSAALKAAGVSAVPSYTVIPQDGQAEQAVLDQAVKDVGAEGVLITRLVSREQKTEVTPGFYQPVPTMGMYGWYSSAWVGYYEPPTVYQYDVVTADTSVYSVNAGTLLWSGTTETFSPTDVAKETRGFAKIIIGALKKEGII